MYQLWVSMFGDVETPPDDQKWSVLTRTWDDQSDLVWANGLRTSGCRLWHEVDTVSVLKTKMEIRFLISTYLHDFILHCSFWCRATLEGAIGLWSVLISFAKRSTCTIHLCRRFHLTIGTNRWPTYGGCYHRCWKPIKYIWP